MSVRGRLKRYSIAKIAFFFALILPALAPASSGFLSSNSPLGFFALDARSHHARLDANENAQLVSADSWQSTTAECLFATSSNGGFSGRIGQGFELKNVPGQPVRNIATEINGRTFTGHALDQMQNRGIPPSVVENTIRTGQRFTGLSPGTHGFYDAVNRVRVILDSASGRVVTVIPGGP